MSNLVYGEVSYDDDSIGPNRSNSRDLFIRLDAGHNELRLLTKPYQYLSHKYKKEGDAGWGQKVYCSAPHKAGCPLCDAGDEPKARWLYGVICRKTGMYKILDVPWTVFDQIKKLANNARWQDPTKYDVDIIVDKKAKSVGYYTVQPLSKEPLSASDMLIKDNIDLEDLVRRVTPPTYEQVQKRLDKINGTPTDSSAPATTSASKKSSPPARQRKVQQVALTDDDETEEFPQYEQGNN